jgi:hypothetical protein
MDLLQAKNESFLKAFNYECFSIEFENENNRRANLMASYDYDSDQNLAVIQEGICQGLEIFESLFGFRSRSSIAPCYVWDSKIEDCLKANGVKYLQGSRFQNIPIRGSNRFKKKFHFNGEQNSNGQYYFQRNCLFEPSLNHSIDWVDKCLESIGVAFQMNKPAIIGSHRINYCGSIDPDNRSRSLHLLRSLLRSILVNWPDVEFVSSSELHNTYEMKKGFSYG